MVKEGLWHKVGTFLALVSLVCFYYVLLFFCGIRCLAFLAIACCSLGPWTNVCLLVVLPILVEVGVCVYVQSMLSSFGAFGWSVVLVSLRRFFGPFLVNVRCALVFLGPIFVYWIKWFWKNYRVKKFMSMSNPRATIQCIWMECNALFVLTFKGSLTKQLIELTLSDYCWKSCSPL